MQIERVAQQDEANGRIGLTPMSPYDMRSLSMKSIQSDVVLVCVKFHSNDQIRAGFLDVDLEKQLITQKAEASTCSQTRKTTQVFYHAKHAR